MLSLVFRNLPFRLPFYASRQRKFIAVTQNEKPVAYDDIR